MKTGIPFQSFAYAEQKKYSKKQKKLYESKNDNERIIALDVLSGLGQSIENSRGVFFDERLEIALEAIKDKNEDIVTSGAYALAAMVYDDTEQAIKALISLKDSSDDDTRYAVARGLGGIDTPEAIQALLQLTSDNIDRVRDWATFGLVQCDEADSPEIRQAFRDRLSDPFEDVRQEAIWGLAKRRDAEGLQWLIDRLEDDYVDRDILEAEEILDTDPDSMGIEELCDGLRRLSDKE